ncbi:universal stress protein [Salinispira pacifica]
MTVVVAIDRSNGKSLVARAGKLFGTGSPYVLVHVIDTGPGGQLAMLLRSPPGLPGRSRRVPESHAKAADVVAESVLSEATNAADAAGVGAERVLLRGDPGREIVSFLSGKDAIVVVGDRAAGSPRATSPGRPPSLHPPVAEAPRPPGKTARFIIDHAPCDVAIVRLG